MWNVGSADRTFLFFAKEFNSLSGVQTERLQRFEKNAPTQQHNWHRVKHTQRRRTTVETAK
jgi:hypothetical protein